MNLRTTRRWPLAGLMAVVVASLLYGCAAERRSHEPPDSSIRESLRNWGTLTPRETTPTVNPGGATQPNINGQTITAPPIPGSRPNRDEELWVIEKKSPDAQPQPHNDIPGSGALMAEDPQTKTQIPIPLKHTSVKASIAGYIATVEVTQQYHNPFDTKIEALYVFPLPHNAAVNEFVLTIGQRHIRGIIRERQEAQRIYNEAKSQGYVAALLTQERPNVFTQSIANIEPGKQIDIDIKYFHTLSYLDGAYEFVFPMVVGPRFNPPDITTGIGAVARGAQGTSGQKTEIQYLHPTERSGHDIALSLHLDAGVTLEKIDCPSHQITTTQPTPQTADITLAPSNTLPNRDFILHYKVAGQTTKLALLTQRHTPSSLLPPSPNLTPSPGTPGEGRGEGPFPLNPESRTPNPQTQTQPNSPDSYFTLLLYPPAQLQTLPRKPLELVFVVDVSGSQEGAPLAQEKAAVRYALTHMNDQDTFQVIRFGDTAEKLGPSPFPATPDNVRRALAWVDSFRAGGGTILVDGLRAALDFPHDQSRLRFVSFMTDGFIGNEPEALSEIHRLLGPSRIFSFGVGNSTNRYLLEHMAKLGNGAVAFLSTQDNADEIMQQFFDRISHPALTDIAIDWGTMQVDDVYPQRIPDLFVGRPVLLTGRFHGHGKPTLTIKGQMGPESHTMTLTPDLDDPAANHDGISAVWARNKIADLYDRVAWEANPRLPDQIKQLALENSLMSAFTAFLAVDAAHKTEGPFGVSVPVPVPVPDGVHYDTTVQQKLQPAATPQTLTDKIADPSATER